MLVIVKKAYYLLLIIGLLGLATAVLLTTRYISSRYLETSTPKRTVVKCAHEGKQRFASIKSDVVEPHQTNARACDSLTITNLDDRLREISFGPHDNHEVYDGVYHKTLGKNQSFKIDLKQLGLYRFHDHYNDEVSGYFDVK